MGDICPESGLVTLNALGKPGLVCMGISRWPLRKQDPTDRCYQNNPTHILWLGSLLRSLLGLETVGDEKSSPIP